MAVWSHNLVRCLLGKSHIVVRLIFNRDEKRQLCGHIKSFVNIQGSFTDI